jgi:hypothetical protein
MVISAQLSGDVYLSIQMMSTQLSGGYLADYPQDVYPGGGKNSGDDGHDNKEDISAKVP